MRRAPSPRLLPWLFALSIGLPGCSSDASTADAHPCPPGGTKLSYDSFGRGFLDRYCEGCHGASVGNRQGAPFDYDFATRDDVQKHRDRIYARAADDNTSMPPGPDDPPEAERRKLGEWLGCGAP